MPGESVIVGTDGGQVLRLSQSRGFQALHSLISIYIFILLGGGHALCKGQKTLCLFH